MDGVSYLLPELNVPSPNVGLFCVPENRDPVPRPAVVPVPSPVPKELVAVPNPSGLAPKPVLVPAPATQRNI